jgi:hypothetical protein
LPGGWPRGRVASSTTVSTTARRISMRRNGYTGGLRGLLACAAGMVISCEVGTRARRSHRPRRRPGGDYGRRHAFVDGIGMSDPSRRFLIPPASPSTRCGYVSRATIDNPCCDAVGQRRLDDADGLVVSMPTQAMIGRILSGGRLRARFCRWLRRQPTETADSVALGPRPAQRHTGLLIACASR